VHAKIWHRDILLGRAQYGYMLLRDSLFNGVRGVTVHGLGILNIGMMQCVEKNVHEILARNTKIVRDRY
jgi:hypothetical protein